ncbi:sigma-70 family RNA polymerase sigma factor [Flavobacterium sp. GCM10027622]|uniref:sigma-70 family RNA polymerase sigma factor n=1 Tax=unclassified Flavobacterium TaxID=196869 RepID=UPI00362081CE
METIDIWKQFSENLKGYIVSKIKDTEITKDLLQEVFIKIHLNNHKLKNTDSLKSWVFSITHNTIIDYFKSQSKPIPLLELPDNEETNHHSAENCIIPLINHLPEKYKEALLLSEIKGKKQQEVAEILNITLPGAKSRIQRGRKLLQQGLIDCCDYTLNNKGFLVGEHKDKENCKVCN